jgi:hypothetical protein
LTAFARTVAFALRVNEPLYSVELVLGADPLVV